MKTMKQTLMLLGIAMFVGGCSSHDEDAMQAEDNLAPIIFGIASTDATDTRAGYEGEVNNSILCATGFGVYAYVTRDAEWPASGSTNNYMPDFMCNQYISNSWGTEWSYEPVKYWPNTEKVSFFAYAPYVRQSEVFYDDVATAMADAITDGQDGILAIPRPTTKGDPQIAYRIGNPAHCVDLTCCEALNKTKLMVNEPVLFFFRHTLARFVVHVDFTSAVDWDDTRVLIKKVKLTEGQGLYKMGVLSLKSSSTSNANWQNQTEKEDDLTYMVPATLKYEEGKSFAQQPGGVKELPTSLFGMGRDGRSPASLQYIPGPASSDPVKLQITFMVVSSDGTETEYVKEGTTATAGTVFEAGRTTRMNIHLTTD